MLSLDQTRSMGLFFMPSLADEPDMEADKLAKKYMLLLQRYLFVLLRDTIGASQMGSCVNRQMLVLSMAHIIADQPQERALLGMRKMVLFVTANST